MSHQCSCAIASVVSDIARCSVHLAHEKIRHTHEAVRVFLDDRESDQFTTHPKQPRPTVAVGVSIYEPTQLLGSVTHKVAFRVFGRDSLNQVSQLFSGRRRSSDREICAFGTETVCQVRGERECVCSRVESSSLTACVSQQRTQDLYWRQDQGVREEAVDCFESNYWNAFTAAVPPQ
jgi:hypothetical protein